SPSPYSFPPRILRSYALLNFSSLDPHKIFFFSSRRRHTRWPRDWSSDVCSSDLAPGPELDGDVGGVGDKPIRSHTDNKTSSKNRSEERRVGKECRSGWSPD